MMWCVGTSSDTVVLNTEHVLTALAVGVCMYVYIHDFQRTLRYCTLHSTSSHGSRLVVFIFVGTKMSQLLLILT